MSRLVLTVDDGRVADAARFFAAGTKLLDALDAISDNASVDWKVTQLRTGSAVAAIEPVGEAASEGDKAVLSLVKGLRDVQAGQPAPVSWSPEAVACTLDLARAVDGHTKVEDADNVVWLDERLRQALELQTPWTREFYGSVRGTLTGVNVTRGNRASIRPQGGGRVVHVGFPSSLAEEMAQALLGFVEVDGMVKQNADGRNYYIAAEAVQTQDQPLKTWLELRGSVPEITGGLSTKEYLEAIRGED